MRRWVVVAMILVGCEPEAPEYQGIWTMDSPPCGLALNLEDQGRYSEVWVCPLSPGVYGAERENGIYSVKGSSITFTATEWTCPTDKTVTLDFAASGSELRLNGPGGVLLLSRFVSTGQSGGTLVYGCFAEDGTFTQSPLVPAR